MFSADVLTFREFMMGEPLPLATLHQAVLEFLRGRDDVVVFGAQAVNAYVNEPRMTQDLDLLSTHADGVAQELCAALRQRFHIAVRVRRVGAGAWGSSSGEPGRERSPRRDGTLARKRGGWSSG